MEFTRIATGTPTPVKNTASETLRTSYNAQATKPEQVETRSQAVTDPSAQAAVEQARRSQNESLRPRDSRVQFRAELNRIVGQVQNEDGEYVSKIPPEEVLKMQESIKRNAREMLGTLFEDKF